MKTWYQVNYVNDLGDLFTTYMFAASIKGVKQKFSREWKDGEKIKDIWDAPRWFIEDREK